MKKSVLASALLGVLSFASAEEIVVSFTPIFTKKGVFYIKSGDFGKEYSKIIEKERLEPYRVDSGTNASSLGSIEIKCDKEKTICGYNLIREYVKEHNKNFKPKEEPKSMYGGLFN